VTFKFMILNSASQLSFLVRTPVLRYTANLTPMELRSQVLAEVETGHSGPGVPGPSSLVTEGSGEPLPDSAISRHSITKEAGASPSHPSTAGLMGATLRAPIAGSSQMLERIGAIVNPDVHANTEHDLALEMGTEARPTQPPQPFWIVDVPSGYPEDLETFGTPDTVNNEDILGVDVTPLTSISISGMDVTSCPDMSVAKSKSVDLGISMSVEFDDRVREIQDTTSSFATDTASAYSQQFRNSSRAHVTITNHVSLHDYGITRLAHL